MLLLYQVYQDADILRPDRDPFSMIRPPISPKRVSLVFTSRPLARDDHDGRHNLAKQLREALRCARDRRRE
jgi:hypothetical protein